MEPSALLSSPPKRSADQPGQTHPPPLWPGTARWMPRQVSGPVSRADARSLGCPPESQGGSVTSGASSLPKCPGPLICPALVPSPHSTSPSCQLCLCRDGEYEASGSCDPHPNSLLACRALVRATAIGPLPRAPSPTWGLSACRSGYPRKGGGRNESPLTCPLSVAAGTGDEYGV